MKNIKLTALIIAVTMSCTIANAPAQTSAYAGQETREIKSLSADDIEELRRGGGWGLAKAAELNGMPGPAHLLELKDQVPLTGDQVSAIETIYADMQDAAIEKGEQLIALETELEVLFANKTITESELSRLLNAISQTRRDLRFIHLSTHLSMLDLVFPDQVEKYNELRGYGDDPCLNIPEGHNAEQWKMHNNCT